MKRATNGNKHRNFAKQIHTKRVHESGREGENAHQSYWKICKPGVICIFIISRSLRLTLWQIRSIYFFLQFSVIYMCNVYNSMKYIQAATGFGNLSTYNVKNIAGEIDRGKEKE